MPVGGPLSIQYAMPCHGTQPLLTLVALGLRVATAAIILLMSSSHKCHIACENEILVCRVMFDLCGP